MHTIVERTWDFLNKEQRERAKKEIIAYFESERAETIGVVAANELLDTFLQGAGKEVYNKALDDVRIFLEKKFADVGVDLDISLRK